jgi:hypothetical protein
MRAGQFITESTTTLNKLYNGKFPDRYDEFWDYVSPHEFDRSLNIKTLSKFNLASTLLSQYRVEHIDELVAMLNDDQRETLEKYMQDQTISNRVILISDNRIIDGNHRALAAALNKVSINYVDLADLDELDVTESISCKTPSEYTWSFEPGDEVPWKSKVEVNTFIRVKDDKGKTVLGVWADVYKDTVEVQYSEVFDKKLRGKGIYTDFLKGLSKHYNVISDQDHNNAAREIYKKLGAAYDYKTEKHTLSRPNQGVAEDSYKEGGSITHDGVEYDFDKVLAIAETKPTKQCAVSKLAWVLAYDEPDATRLKNSDISVPVVITKSNNGKLTVIDGLHRLAKAVDTNINSLPVKYITNDELQSARLKQGVAEDTLNEFAKGEGGFGPFKLYKGGNYKMHEIGSYDTLKQAEEELEIQKDLDTDEGVVSYFKIEDGTGEQVGGFDPDDAYDNMRSGGKIQFRKQDGPSDTVDEAKKRRRKHGRSHSRRSITTGWWGGYWGDSGDSGDGGGVEESTQDMAEDISRRNLLKGVGGLATGVGAGISGKQAQAGPYVDASEQTTEQFVFFEKQIPKLQSRARGILGRLLETLATNYPKSWPKVQNVTVQVGWVNRIAVADTYDNQIELDVTVFYDLSDDAIACTLGHELGHFVYGTKSYHLNPKQEELKADIYGIRLVKLSGYNTAEALRSIWEAGEHFRKGGKTHPSYDERLKAARAAGYPNIGTTYLDPAKHQRAIGQLRSTAAAIQGVQGSSTKQNESIKKFESQLDEAIEGGLWGDNSSGGEGGGGE